MIREFDLTVEYSVLLDNKLNKNVEPSTKPKLER